MTYWINRCITILFIKKKKKNNLIIHASIYGNVNNIKILSLKLDFYLK